MYTHISKIVTTTDTVYTSINNFIKEHGECGANHPLVIDSQLELNPDNSVTRTLVYASIDDRESHRNYRESERNYTVTFISETTE
jgi:hypothetical protein